MRRAFCGPRSLAAGLVVLITMLAAATPAAAAAPCDRIASPTGSDAAAGTEAAPFKTAQTLADALLAGQTGCLRAGTYGGGITFRRGGTAGAPLTLRPYPGEAATVQGLVWVSKTAPWVVVEGLYLNGRGIGHPSPTINAADVTFRSNDVTNDNTGICFLLGDPASGGYGRADRAVIERNKIHNCGQLPATNYHHGIYLEATSGSRVEGNWIYDNADFGVHLYPDADRTTVRGNVIDGNGKGLTISGDSGWASDGNTIEGNAITDSKLRFNVEAWWPKGNPVPAGNLVAGNCLRAGPVDWYDNGGIDMEVDAAFTLQANSTVSNPGYADRAGKDFRLTSASSCRSSFVGDPSAVPGPAQSAATAPAPTPQPAAPPAPAREPVPGPTPVRAPQPGAGSASHPRKPPRLRSTRCSSRPRVALRVEGGGSAPDVQLTGHVARSFARRARQGFLQVRTARGWKTVKRARFRGRGRFVANWRLSTASDAGIVQVRAVVPRVGRSGVCRMVVA
jgi:parallel beta-helix repeat protein